MNILYVHGLGSGKNSKTLEDIKIFFNDYIVHGIEVNENAAESVKKIQYYVDHNDIDIIIGCSMGGFYASYIMNVKHKFLVNPAFQIVEIIKDRIGFGVYEYFCEREDKNTYYSLSTETVDNIRYFMMSNDPISNNSYAIFSINDSFVGSEIQLKNIYSAQVYGFNLIIDKDFEHRINESVLNKIKTILCEIC